MLLKIFLNLFVAAITISAHVISRSIPPGGRRVEVLESYNERHTRYLALNRPEHHSQDVFERCCHPLEADESLNTAIPSECGSSSSATTSDSLNEPACIISTDDEDKDYNGREDEKVNSTPSGFVTTLISSTPALETIADPKAARDSSIKSKRVSTRQSSSEVITGGFATYYAQGNIGTCGVAHFDSDLVAAINIARFTDSSLCGSQVKITNTNNGATVTVTISDTCITCLNENSLDLSPGAFLHLSPTLDTGIIPISWFFV